MQLQSLYDLDFTHTSSLQLVFTKFVHTILFSTFKIDFDL